MRILPIDLEHIDLNLSINIDLDFITIAWSQFLQYWHIDCLKSFFMLHIFNHYIAWAYFYNWRTISLIMLHIFNHYIRFFNFLLKLLANFPLLECNVNRLCKTSSAFFLSSPCCYLCSCWEPINFSIFVINRSLDFFITVRIYSNYKVREWRPSQQFFCRQFFF